MLRISLSAYLAVGQHLERLNRNLGGTPVNSEAFYLSASQLKDFLSAFNFKSSFAVGEIMWRTVERIGQNGMHDAAAVQMLNDRRAGLLSALDAISRALHTEAGERQMTELKVGDVSHKLRDLPNRVTLADPQKHLLEETTRCLECEAYRSAAVMGWNLAYDYIRQWIVSDPTRLTAFNAELTKDQNFTAIVNPEDFYEQPHWVSEQRVLNCCNAAGLFGQRPFGEKVFRNLSHYLRERNQYAHPNDTTPTMHTTNAYLENLITVITTAPFR